MNRINRRDFLRGGAAATLAAATPRPARAMGAPAVHTRTQIRPLVIASENGQAHRDPSGMTCVERAFASITGGMDVLDAVVAGVEVNELDPEDTSVGYGGLPNADGTVQLDASVMHGPLRRAGAVAALQGVRTPARVAKAVLENTDHHLLVGADAQVFARQMGFSIENDLTTERSRAMWLEWRRRTDGTRWLDPRARSDAGHRAGLQMVAEGLIDAMNYYGTIHCSGLSARGEICAVTSTSGLAWKIPGRVGDSPILGAGLYLDNAVGSVGSTGRGEANLYNLTSYLIVENLRRGMHPKDAGLEGLRRIRQNTVERRLLSEQGTPVFNIAFYILNARGEHAGVSMYGGVEYAVCTENGPQLLRCEPLMPGEAPH
jgi:N4-(beta-N-acetylglucosaminyl)-L-asparaginase